MGALVPTFPFVRLILFTVLKELAKRILREQPPMTMHVSFELCGYSKPCPREG